MALTVGDAQKVANDVNLRLDVNLCVDDVLDVLANPSACSPDVVEAVNRALDKRGLS
jgi:hypothetical protein